MPDPPSRWPARFDWLVVSLFALTFSLPSLFTRDLWNPDEPRYAQVAVEMRARGEYLVPHLNGAIYAEKPPLFFWLSALLQSLGLGIASGRIVVAAAAVGCLLLTRELARLWFPDRAGLLAAMILASTLLFAAISKMGVLDVPLAFLTTLAAYGWFRHLRDGGAWSLLFFIGIGLATLIKGPVGILIPCLAIVATLLVPGRPAARSPHLLWGGLLTILIVGAWLVPACLQGGPEYTNIILFRQSVGRMVSSWAHQRAWYYHLVSLPIALFPWFVFLPWAIVHLWKMRSDEAGVASRRLILWYALGLLFFSLISGKRGRYMLPLLPPLAIMFGVFFDEALRTDRSGAARAWMRRLFSLQYAQFLLLGLILLAAPLIAGGAAASARPDWERGPSAVADLIEGIGQGPLIACAIALWAIGLIGWWMTRRGSFARALAIVLTGTVTLSLGLDLLLTPGLNQLKSAREVGSHLNALVPPGGPGRVALYPGDFSGVYNLYTGRVRMPVLSQPVDIDRFLAESPANAVLTNEDSYRRNGAGITIPHRVIEVKNVGHRSILFLVADATEGSATAPVPRSGDPPG